MLRTIRLTGAHRPTGSLCRHAAASAPPPAQLCLKPATRRPAWAHRPVRRHTRTVRNYFLPLPLPLDAEAAASFSFLASSFCFCLKAMSSCDGKKRTRKQTRGTQGGVEQRGGGKAPRVATQLARQHQRPCLVEKDPTSHRDEPRPPTPQDVLSSPQRARRQPRVHHPPLLSTKPPSPTKR